MPPEDNAPPPAVPASQTEPPAVPPPAPSAHGNEALSDAAPAGDATGIDAPVGDAPAGDAPLASPPAHGAVSNAGTPDESYYDATRGYWVSAAVWREEHPVITPMQPGPTGSGSEGSPSTPDGGTPESSGGDSDADSSLDSDDEEAPAPERTEDNPEGLRLLSVPVLGEWFCVVVEDGRTFYFMCDGSDRTGGIRVCLRKGAVGVNLNDGGTDLAGRM